MSIRDLFVQPYGNRTPVTDFDWCGPNDWNDHTDIVKHMELAIEDGSYTQDLPSLMKMERQLIFTYGTLREGFKRNRMLAGQEFVGYASTGNHYNMYVTNNYKDPFPVVMLEGRADHMGAIFGEVYSVVPSCLRTLDYVESNGTVYKRYLTPVYIGNKDGTTHRTNAWMYKGLRSFWSSRMANLHQIKPNAKDKSRYYMFTERHVKAMAVK